MKIRIFLAALMALVISCKQEFVPSTLNTMQVSASYVAISQDGGSTTISLTATESWEITKDEDTDWVTVSPESGDAGENMEITFSAEPTANGREGYVYIKCSYETQIITVIQGETEVETVTVADVLAGEDGKVYRVTGICTYIYNTYYGNWYLSDDSTDEILVIYGTVNSSGDYGDWDSFNIEVGDEVTVQGQRTTYYGTIELVDVSVISVNKSLISVESVDPEDGEIDYNGGSVAVTLSCSGDGIEVSVPDEAQSWLSLKSISGTSSSPVITFSVAATTASEDREVSITFTTHDSSGTAYTAAQTITQVGYYPLPTGLTGKGTETEPYTVSDALRIFANGSYRTYAEDSVYVKGVISDTPSVSTDYGNANFYISDDGQNSNTVYVYRCYYLENENFTSAEQISAGDSVVICGNMEVYEDTYELVSCYIYSHTPAN